MAENEKQRFRAKPQILPRDIENGDLLILEHNPNTENDQDRSLRMDLARDFFTALEKARAENVEGILRELINVINSKIPSNATDENQLADKDFVNSSISTNTAYPIGTFSSFEELEAYSEELTNNDYAYVIVNESGNRVFKRYKWNEKTQKWKYEFDLNTTGFTAEQWATINSKITTETLTRIDCRFDDLKDEADDARNRISYLADDLDDYIDSTDKEILNIKNKMFQLSDGDNTIDYNSKNLNAGVYRITSDDAIFSFPPNMSNNFGQLFVMSGGAYPTQIFSIEGDDNEDIWYRKWDGEEWSKWLRILTPNSFSYNPATGELNLTL